MYMGHRKDQFEFLSRDTLQVVHDKFIDGYKNICKFRGCFQPLAILPLEMKQNPNQGFREKFCALITIQDPVSRKQHSSIYTLAKQKKKDE